MRHRCVAFFVDRMTLKASPTSSPSASPQASPRPSPKTSPRGSPADSDSDAPSEAATEAMSMLGIAITWTIIIIKDCVCKSCKQKASSDTPFTNDDPEGTLFGGYRPWANYKKWTEVDEYGNTIYKKSPRCRLCLICLNVFRQLGSGLTSLAAPTHTRTRNRTHTQTHDETVNDDRQVEDRTGYVSSVIGVMNGIAGVKSSGLLKS